MFDAQARLGTERRDRAINALAVGDGASEREPGSHQQ
jgi:hypothetical protein